MLAGVHPVRGGVARRTNAGPDSDRARSRRAAASGDHRAGARSVRCRCASSRGRRWTALPTAPPIKEWWRSAPRMLMPSWSQVISRSATAGGAGRRGRSAQSGRHRANRARRGRCRRDRSASPRGRLDRDGGQGRGRGARVFAGGSRGQREPDSGGVEGRGFWIYGLDEAGAATLWPDSITPNPPCSSWAAKDTGCIELVKKNCDVVVRIPMAGAISSLNVSVAAGVALFEWRRQTTGQNTPE